MYEASAIVRIASPVHLKAGNSVLGGHGELTSEHDGVRLAKQVAIVKEMVTRYSPEFAQSAAGAPDLAIPE